MAETEETVAAFLAQLARTPDLWRSLDIRLIGVNLNGEWHTLLGRFRVDDREPDAVPRLTHLPRSDSIACWQDVRPASSLELVLREIASGELNVGNDKVFCRSFSDKASDQIAGGYKSAYLSIATHVGAASTISRPSSLVAHVLRLGPISHGQSLLERTREGREEITRFLRALSHPFDGVNGLARVALQMDAKPEHHNDPCIEIIAPLGAAIEREYLTLDQGKLGISVWAGSEHAANRCTIGFIGETESGSYKNGTLEISSHAWVGFPSRRAKIAHDLPPEIRRVTVFLRVGPNVVDTQEIDDRGHATDNLLLSAYSFCDPGLENLRGALASRLEKGKQPKGRDLSRDFEHAVARLFSLAGFHAEALGGFPGNEDCVDVLIHTPNRDLLFTVECTIESWHTTKGKPHRLIRRTRDLQGLNKLAGSEVLPMMITARSRDEIPPSEIELASLDNLIILCYEDLLEILRRAESGATVNEIVQFCRARIARSLRNRRGPFGLV